MEDGNGVRSHSQHSPNGEAPEKEIPTEETVGGEGDIPSVEGRDREVERGEQYRGREGQNESVEGEANDHLASIYESQEDQFQVVVPFIEQGLNQEERCLYVADDNTVDEVRTALRKGGIDVNAAVERGALSFHTRAYTYLQEGEFETGKMLQFWQETLAEAKEEGYAGIRAAAEMTWALEDGALGEEQDFERLADYEAMLNSLYTGEEYVVLCQYNRERFPDALLSDIIQSHPLVVTAGTVCENSYYQSPGIFLGGARARLDVDRTLEELSSRAHTKGEKQEVSERLRRWTRQQEVVADLGQLGLEAQDLDRVLSEAVEHATEALGADYCSILEVQGEAQGLCLREAAGRIEEPDEETIHAASDPLAERALQAGRPVLEKELEARSGTSAPTGESSGVGAIIGPTGDPWGAMAAYTRRQPPFSEQDAAFLQSVANTLASVVERTEHEHYQRELHEITTNSELSFDEKVERLLELGCDRFGLERGILLEKDSERLCVVETHGTGLEAGGATLLANVRKYCNQTIASEAPVGVEEVEAGGGDEGSLHRKGDLCCYLGTKIRQGTEGGGVLAFTSTSSRGREFTDAEYTFLDLMGQWISNALNRQESRRALRENKDRLSAKVADMERLHALSTRLLEEENVESALHEVMIASAELLGAGKASVQIYDEAEGALRLVSALGFDQTFHEQFDLIRPDAFTTCAATLERRDPVLVEDLFSDPEFAEFARAVAPYGVEAALSTPLHGSDGQLFGVFTMYWEEPHRPSEDELRLLDLYTQQAAQQIERKRAAETLQEREEYLSALFQTTPECIKVVAEDGTLLQMNPAGLDMVEADSASSVVGDCVYDLVAPEDQERFRAFNEKICRGERGMLQFDIIGLAGTRRHMESHAAPLRLSEGEIVQVALTRDITQQKRREERLRDLNETLEDRVEKRTRQVRELTSQLTMAEQQERRRIARILHDDLQQRLYGIQLKMASLRSGVGTKGSAPEGAADGGKRLSREICEMEERMEAAIQTARQLSVDMSPPVLESDGLTGAVEWLQSHMKELYGLSVKLTAEQEFPMGNEDWQVLLFQTVRELLFNVVKHAGVDRAVVELLEGEGKDLVIRVRDEGRGFDPDEVEDEGYGGSFGLTAVRERIRPFGGKMTIDTVPGEGTTVTLRVPQDGYPGTHKP